MKIGNCVWWPEIMANDRTRLRTVLDVNQTIWRMDTTNIQKSRLLNKKKEEMIILTEYQIRLVGGLVAFIDRA